MNFHRIAVIIVAIVASGAKEVFRSDGDFNVAVLVRKCKNSTFEEQLIEQSSINSAIWTTERINFLEIASPFRFGLTVFEVCGENECLETIFALHRNGKHPFYVGVITNFEATPKLKEFSNALDLKFRPVVRCLGFLVKAVVSFLGAFNWRDNVTVVVPNRFLAEAFSEVSRREWICVKDFLVIISEGFEVLRNSTGTLVVFGNHSQMEAIAKYLYELNQDDPNLILVPTDGVTVNEMPINSYVLLPPQSPFPTKNKKNSGFLPTPLLFDIAIPLISYAYRDFNCNETNKTQCLLNNIQRSEDKFLEPLEIINLLQIDPLKEYFVYNFLKFENFTQPYRKLLHYNMFTHNLSQSNFSRVEAPPSDCKNFEFDLNFSHFHAMSFKFREESWVFAYLSISLLGILLCVIILIFLFVALCRGEIFDGNPVLTILLVFAVILIFSSILPLAIEGDKFTQETICLTRSVAITESFAAVFSLMLSRSILIASASKEIGFMSHVSGSVQAFLCMFIFGVQAALSLQLFGRCRDIFREHYFVYHLSYNAMLLVLLLSVSPLIYKCQRNYREGKYFTICGGVVSGCWCLWIPCYIFLGKEYKDAVLGFGLLSTAAIIIAAIFIPRTYLMTIAAARNKITGTLPSLTTATSTLDIFKTSTQPIYDCVNVAAINAITIAGLSARVDQEADINTEYQIPEDENFDSDRTSPASDDKITRF